LLLIPDIRRCPDYILISKTVLCDVCSRILILEKDEIVRDVQKTESTLAELEEFFTGVKEERSFHDEL
jgi:ABC-2 type transport system ATP-binding protein